MKKFFLCCFLFLSACGEKSFETTSSEQTITSTDNDDSLLEIQQINSGGGISYAEDNSFSAETTIGSVVHSTESTETDILVSLGLFDILKFEF